MIVLVFIGYWPSLEDINRWQHETPTQELKLRPKDNARTGAYRPCHCQPAAECGEAEDKGESDVQADRSNPAVLSPND
jgi:hypothetical protein